MLPALRINAWCQFLLLASIFACANGCVSKSETVINPRPFVFGSDTFAYENQLKWEYSFNNAGEWSAQRRDPPPDYTLHCFVVARSAKQFFENALFVKGLPKDDPKTTRDKVRKLISTNPRTILPAHEKMVFPGYSDLRDFSASNESLLKEECGSAWQSYLQRGHWRMVLPFSKRNQEKEAEQLQRKIKNNHSPVVHIVRFPSLDVNHAILLFGVKDDAQSIRFDVYDPNKPDNPSVLTFDKKSKQFEFPQNDYFIGGAVDVYEVYSTAFK